MARITVGRVLDSSTDSVTAEQGTPPWLTKEVTGLLPEEYDYVFLTHTDELLTQAVFRTGGAGGTIVATIDITYDSNDCIQTVTRT